MAFQGRGPAHCEHRIITKELEIRYAAGRELRRMGYTWESRHGLKGNHGPDLPVWLGISLVGMGECKRAWDLATKGNGPRKAVRDALGRLMFDGYAKHRGLPLALFVGASDFDFEAGKAVLTRLYPDVEREVREALARLGVHLILCAQIAKEYRWDGLQQFMERVDEYAKHSRRAGPKRTP